MDCGPIFDWMRVLNQDCVVYPCRLAAVVINDYDSDDKDDDDNDDHEEYQLCLLYTSPSPRDKRQSRMPSSA